MDDLGQSSYRLFDSAGNRLRAQENVPACMSTTSGSRQSTISSSLALKCRNASFYCEGDKTINQSREIQVRTTRTTREREQGEIRTRGEGGGESKEPCAPYMQQRRRTTAERRNMMSTRAFHNVDQSMSPTKMLRRFGTWRSESPPSWDLES